MQAITTTIILSILSKNEEMYGYELIKEINKESKGTFTYKEGTLYPLLHSLEQEGAICSRWEETSSARKRKYYQITSQGRRLLEEKKREWTEFRSVIEGLIASCEILAGV